MALSLVESAKLSQDMLQRGVIETILEDSPVLQSLPFLTVEGNSYRYNQENTLGGAAFFAVNGAWSEGTATFSEKTAKLAILGGDADVDNFVQRTRSNVTDQRAIQTQLKAKSVARKFEETFEAMVWESHPYGWPTVGWPSDIPAITKAQPFSVSQLRDMPLAPP